MESILLFVMVLCLFAFAFYAADRCTVFFEKNCRPKKRTGWRSSGRERPVRRRSGFRRIPRFFL